MPAPAAVPAVPVPGVPVLGARVVDVRLALLPQAAEADREMERRPRTVNTATSFFMPLHGANSLPGRMRR